MRGRSFQADVVLQFQERIGRFHDIRSKRVDGKVRLQRLFRNVLLHLSLIYFLHGIVVVIIDSTLRVPNGTDAEEVS
jgi:hypothetical protein